MRRLEFLMMMTSFLILSHRLLNGSPKLVWPSCFLNKPIIVLAASFLSVINAMVLNTKKILLIKVENFVKLAYIIMIKANK